MVLSYEEAYEKPLKELDVCDAIGEHGNYQMSVMFFANISFIVVTPILMGTAFYVPDIDHWCKQPEPLWNMSVHEWKTLALPVVDPAQKTFDQCHMYQVDVAANGSYHVDKDVIRSCQEWDYDRSVFGFTATEYFNMVCDQSWQQQMPQMIIMIGMLLGNSLNGVLCDIYGRRPVILVNFIFFLIFEVVGAFVPFFWLFLVFRFLVGYTINGPYNALVLYMEIVSEPHRCETMISFSVFWGIGIVALGGICYAVQDYVLQFLVFAAINATCFIFWSGIIESPRWLFTVGNYSEACRAVRHICDFNGYKNKSATEVVLSRLIDKYDKNKQEDAPKVTLLDLVRTNPIRIRTITFSVFMFLGMGIYYDISLKTNLFPVSPFMNFVIAGGIEILAGWASLLVIRFMFRKITTIVLLAIAAAIYILRIFFVTDTVWINAVMMFGTRFCVATTLDFSAVYVGELFPTSLRALAFGIANFSAQFGSAVEPYIGTALSTDLIRNTVYGASLLVAAAMALFWPETKGVVLPDFIEEPKKKPTLDDITPAAEF